MQVDGDGDEKTREGDTVTDSLHEDTGGSKGRAGNVLPAEVVDDGTEGLGSCQSRLPGLTRG